MNLKAFLQSRWGRGFSVGRLGPNEARILFDFLAAFAASVVALVFRFFFLPAPVTPLELWAVPVLSIVLVVLNALFGVYSYLRLSPATLKALVLSGSVVLTAALAFALFRDLALVCFWAVAVLPPLTLARFFVSINTGRHPALARIAINRRGPILVVGGAGYIGSHTVALLLSRGHEVRVLDRLIYGDGALKEFAGNPHLTLTAGDATDIAKLTAAVKDCSAVVHLAGLVGDPACAVSPEFTRHTNIVATRMVRTVAESMGIHRFVFASSCSVYGTSDVEVDESSTPKPVSLYAETKLDSERELLSLVRDEFYVTILRFATVFGHSRRPRFDLVANLFTAQAMTDGLITVVGPNQWRPFVHVRDLARAIVTVLDTEPTRVQSQIFNVGDRRANTTILKLAEAVKAVTEKHRPVTISVTESPNDLRNYAVSFEKIRTTLGFEAETLIPAGIEEMVEHYQKGDYAHYKTPHYSNVAMTAKAVDAFNDPEELSHLYAPLGGA